MMQHIQGIILVEVPVGVLIWWMITTWDENKVFFVSYFVPLLLGVSLIIGIVLLAS